MKKPLWKVSVATTLEAEDAVAEMLGDIFNGAASSYYDVEKKVSRVTVFTANKISSQNLGMLRESLGRISDCGLEIGTGKVSSGKVRHEDWAESWKRHFRPIEIGRALLVKPGWSKKRPGAGQAVMVLDPGLSFGTGQHPTTMYCLAKIVKYSKNARSFFDIGTGSGILAIAAAKLGYKRIRAIDFDPEAIRAARANARKNSVLHKMQINQCNVKTLPAKPKESFDLVCANLISDLQVAERQRIVAQLNYGGILVIAGILDSEFVAVQKEFEKSGLKLISSRGKNEWRSGTFCRA